MFLTELTEEGKLPGGASAKRPCLRVSHVGAGVGAVGTVGGRPLRMTAENPLQWKPDLGWYSGLVFKRETFWVTALQAPSSSVNPRVRAVGSGVGTMRSRGQGGARWAPGRGGRRLGLAALLWEETPASVFGP